MAQPSSSLLVRQWLDRLQAGDDAALDGLLGQTAGRLRRLTGKMLGDDFARLRRWEDADDVLQNAALRICRAVRATRPDTPRDYFRLAATQIRRELLDLARRYYGPGGMGTNQESVFPAGDSTPRPADPATDTANPDRLAEWTEFHAAVEAMPGPEREVFELLWYQELSQDEAAELVGVDVRTVQRRWRAARLYLHEAWRGEGE